MSKKKNLELDYYYYHYGNRDADYFISDVLSFKDYKTFMRLYNSPDNGIDYYLPLSFPSSKCTIHQALVGFQIVIQYDLKSSMQMDALVF